MHCFTNIALMLKKQFGHKVKSCWSAQTYTLAAGKIMCAAALDHSLMTVKTQLKRHYPRRFPQTLGFVGRHRGCSQATAPLISSSTKSPNCLLEAQTCVLFALPLLCSAVGRKSHLLLCAQHSTVSAVVSMYCRTAVSCHMSSCI